MEPLALDEMDSRFYSLHTLARWCWTALVVLDAIANEENQ